MNERRAAVTEKVATKIDRFLIKVSLPQRIFFSFALKQTKQLKKKIQERSSP